MHAAYFDRVQSPFLLTLYLLTLPNFSPLFVSSPPSLASDTHILTDIGPSTGYSQPMRDHTHEEN